MKEITCGYLYVAIGEMFRQEAECSARSLRRFTKYPTCLVTDHPTYNSTAFDQIIRVQNIGRSFEVKITGMQLSPFDKTVFLDCDTFVCSSIDDIFGFLEYFDMATTLDARGSSTTF